MTRPPVDPRAVRFDQLVARLVAADVACNGLDGYDPAWRAAMARNLALATLAELDASNPITGEPRNAGLPVDEDDKP